MGAAPDVYKRQGFPRRPQRKKEGESARKAGPPSLALFAPGPSQQQDGRCRRSTGSGGPRHRPEPTAGRAPLPRGGTDGRSRTPSLRGDRPAAVSLAFRTYTGSSELRGHLPLRAGRAGDSEAAGGCLLLWVGAGQRGLGVLPAPAAPVPVNVLMLFLLRLPAGRKGISVGRQGSLVGCYM